MANWYPYGGNYTVTPYTWASSNTTNTIQIVQTWPTPAAVPSTPKGDPDPLEWLRERVDEICELSGIAA